MKARGSGLNLAIGIWFELPYTNRRNQVGPALRVGERGGRLGPPTFLLKNRPFKTNYP